MRKRFFVVLLLCAGLLMTLAACGGDSAGDETTGTDAVSNAVSGTETDAETASSTVTDTEANGDTETVSDTEAEGSVETDTALATETEAATESEPAIETETVSETETVPETDPPAEEETMAPKTTIPVIVDGKTDYVIAAPSAIAEAVADDLAAMTRIMDDRFGAHPETVESAEGKKIELAYTDGRNGLDWSVRIDETSGNIYIQSSGTVGLSRAIQYFVTQNLACDTGDLLVDVQADYAYSYEADQIDNSALLSYEGGDKTVLSPSDAEGKLMTPAWLDTAVIVELRVDIADIGGSFKDSYDLVDFYASTGVNVLWLSPVYDRGDPDYGYVGNGYGNWGVNTIEPSLTGTSRDNYDDGWAVLAEFVDYAHEKGIYILMDIITWGTNGCPLADNHPELFDGTSAWGGPAYAWKRPEFVDWFVDVAVDNLEKSHADGYRCDCEPFTAGYDVFTKLRKEANARGLQPILMSEEGGRRDAAFDCEQDGVLKYGAMSRGQLYQNPTNFFVDGHLKIVTATQRGMGIGGPEQQRDRKIMGTYRYYTNCITNHDYQARDVNGNRLKIGYAAIYAPYIPVWFMGDEIGQTLDGRGVLYFQPVTYGVIGTDPEQTFFHEDVKQMIAIRRGFPELFEEWPLNHPEINICEVEAKGLSNLQNYARYGENQMVIVLANNEPENAGICTVKIPFDALTVKGETGDNYRVTDLLTGRVIAVGFAETVDNFTAIVPYQYCGVYLVERLSE